MGFGGSGLNDLRVFDLRARRGSQVGKDVECHSVGQLALPVVQDDTLCILGGEVYATSLGALAGLIRHSGTGLAFQGAPGLPLLPSGRRWGPELRGWSPLWL